MSEEKITPQEINDALEILDAVVMPDPVTEALVKENVTDGILNDMKEKYTGLKIESLEDKEGYNKVRDARLHCKKMISLTKKVCEAGRKPHIEEQRRWIAKENEIVETLKNLESPLLEQEKKHEVEVEKIKAEKKKADDTILATRMSELVSLGMVFNGTGCAAVVALQPYEITLEEIKNSSGEGFAIFVDTLKKAREAEEIRIKQATEEENQKAKAALEIMEAAKKMQEEAEAKAKAEEEAIKAAEEKELRERDAAEKLFLKEQADKANKEKDEALAKAEAEKAEAIQKAADAESARIKAVKEAEEAMVKAEQEKAEAEKKLAEAAKAAEESEFTRRKKALTDLGFYFEAGVEGKPTPEDKDRLSFHKIGLPLASLRAATAEKFESVVAGCKVKVDEWHAENKKKVAAEEADALAEASAKLSEENARKEELKPDIEKLGDWLESIRSIKKPVVNHNWAKAISSGVITKLEAAENELHEFITKNTF